VGQAVSPASPEWLMADYRDGSLTCIRRRVIFVTWRLAGCLPLLLPRKQPPAGAGAAFVLWTGESIARLTDQGGSKTLDLPVSWWKRCRRGNRSASSTD